MHRFMNILVLTITSLWLVSCASKQFTEGKYDDMSEDRLLDDKFNESDMRQIAEAMTQSLIGSAAILGAKKPPIVLVTMVKNRSQEHIDMKSMTDKMRVSLIKSGKFRFTEKEVRSELADELEYQNKSGYVDASSARIKGRQIGAQYFLTGEITDRVQEVASKKYVYYKATFNLIDIQSGIIEWTDEKEIRKYYQKRSVSM